MRLWYQILLPLLSLFFVRVDLTDLFPLSIPVKNHKVYDGDTVLAGHGAWRFKVRLAMIDAPEKSQRFLFSNENAGMVSKACLLKFLPSQANLQIFGFDQYGRILGDLNGLTLTIIREGCASLYPLATFSSASEKYRYLEALQKAKASRRGLWQYGGYLQPKLWRKLNKRNADQRLR